ncbi:hypothetical protein GCM10009740_34040 [Terrabacter terrae]|uniref:DUF308 domain-containing protein n=1 Tax=Terrabacter terrae TaxID=318434 RepID=A0ABN2UKB4_9MICO
MSDRDLDAEFARIIAGWDDEAPDPQLRRPLEPQQAEPDPARPETGDPSGLTGPSDPTGQATPPLPDEAAPRQPGAADDAADNDGRTPPPNGQPASATPGPPGTPAPPAAAASSGLLELPIAPTTPHVWRGSTEPQHDTGDARTTTGRTTGNGADGASDDDEHFVPPSEIDLPSAENDPMFWAIVGGLVGGPLLLLYLLFFDRDGSGWWLVTALAMVVVGFVLLVLRGGTERDPFDDGTRL